MSGSLKRVANVMVVFAIIWGACFLMTVPFGLDDLQFSLVFSTVLAAVIVFVAGTGRLIKQGLEAWKRHKSGN
ncbi:hypothetical protein [Amycolatopsis sp. NPDC051071]|uniref:hypothetical protein n=1 Tax=Amycolatopsis sp. NPDC051071 TaxID=3154637 RepID=UPI00344559C2